MWQRQHSCRASNCGGCGNSHRWCHRQIRSLAVPLTRVPVEDLTLVQGQQRRSDLKTKLNGPLNAQPSTYSHFKFTTRFSNQHLTNNSRGSLSDTRLREELPPICALYHITHHLPIRPRAA